MLTELGMDWLAFELIDGIRRGNEPVEDEHALARAGERTGHPTSREVHPHPSAAATPILGDDQLKWAAH